MQKKYLLAPGPTPVPPEALLAMAMPIIHHRAPDFLPVLDSAKKGLQWLRRHGRLGVQFSEPR
jgi:aspartate aminotransferase-like enzyme